MRKLKTVFFGSGPVAARSLELLSQEFDIEAVVTKPKPAHHRGTFPVLDVASVLQLPIHTVSSKKELSELLATKPFQSDIAVLIDFGIIVAQDAIDYFPRGIVNSHFSLLPEWRGADPITFAILSGQKRTGVSLMLLVEAMDEGPLLAQAPFDIPTTMTAPELTEALVDLSHESLKSVLPLYLAGQTDPAPQDHVTIADSPVPTYSRKLTKADGILDFVKPAKQLEREVRAFLEWPKSRANLAGIDVIITKFMVADFSGQPGNVEIIDKQLVVFCSQGALVIEKLKPAGKAEMTAQAFIAGYGSKLK
jgi:methionyl-tRNA formyltransferase